MTAVDRITKVQKVNGDRVCRKCGGTKWVDVEIQNDNVVVAHKVPCPECRGKGCDVLVTK